MPFGITVQSCGVHSAEEAIDQLAVADDHDGAAGGLAVLLLVVDAANMTRNLYLLSQIQELQLPLVVALNMMDVAESNGLTIHVDKYSEFVNAPIVPICAQKRKGIEKLKESLLENLECPGDAQYPGAEFPKGLDAGVTALEADLAEKKDVLGHVPSRIEAFRILVDKGGFAERRIMQRLGSGFADVIESHRSKAQRNGSLVTEEAQCRYAWAKKVVASCVQTGTGATARFTEVADSFLTHRVFGTLFLCVVMLGVFQSIYTWATPLMDGIDAVFGMLGSAVSRLIPGDGILQSCEHPHGITPICASDYGQIVEHGAHQHRYQEKICP